MTITNLSTYNKVNEKNKWLTFKLNKEYNIILEETIELLLDNFKNEILVNINENSLILLQLRINSQNIYQHRNISLLEIVTTKNFNTIYDIFKEFWSLRYESYLELIENPELYLFYKIIENKKLQINIEKENSIKINLNKKNNNDLIFGVLNLPNTMDIYQWGDCLINNNYSEAKIFKYRSKAVYEVQIENRILNVNYIINNKILLNFKDFMEGTDLNSFFRIINFKGKKIFIKYENNKIIFKSFLKNGNNIETINKNEYFKLKYITMDLETRTLKGLMSVYCCCIYDGKNLHSFYLTDYNNDEELLINALRLLLLRKYSGYNIYIHNFSNFDVVFLIKILSNLFLDTKIEPIINDNDFINLKVKFAKKYNINFRDSYLLLPSSLKKLAKAFKVEDKGIFPYKFVNNEKILLNYKGKIPSFDTFEGISSEEYNNYCKLFENNNWNLKNETIAYCTQDVKILYKILYEFAINIYKITRINIMNSPTLSSLSFKIYRSNYLEKDYNIKKLTGKIYDFIKKGYIGGAVDVYIPRSNIKIYRYDVNSLYPFIMDKFDMPVGDPKYFEGNIYLIEKDPFGFFEVEVESPPYLKHPILPYKANKNYNFRTIYPLGKWKGVYFSEEIKNSKKYGYNFTILRGYTFKRKNIFKNFVQYFYNLKKNCNKDDVFYTIAKLILNSLAGRFGMLPYKFKHEIIDDKELELYLSKYKLSSILDLNNGKVLISYPENLEEDNNFENIFTNNVNVSIAAAITAYGRIFMSKFKNNTEYNLYYSDTDNLDIDKRLSDNFIGKELGQLKLEAIFEKIVYIAPKVYGGILENGEELIKIKGAKKKINFYELEKLLIKNEKLNINQEKWFKKIDIRTILVKNEMYTLVVTNNKRKLIYNEINQLISTEPFIINEKD